MTNHIIYQWIKMCDSRHELFFLSNEFESWTYSDLAQALRRCELDLNNINPATCLIEGDYSLHSIAWLIAGLSFGWKMVPIVSKSSAVINIRKNVSNATFRVSPENSWGLERISEDVPDIQTHKLSESGVVLFSSGTTGKPKAMCKSMNSMLKGVENQKGKSVTMGLLLLFDHIGGLNTLFAGIRKSAHLVAPSQRSPRIMASLIEKYAVRVLPCSPTFLNMMYLDDVFDEFNLQSLKLITYGTERMPEELLTRLSIKLPSVKFLQTFGTSETGIVQTKSLSSSSTFLTINDPDVEWKIVAQELWIKSNTQILGYLNTSVEAIDGGWFKTGDLVENGSDGYFKIIGRKKEVINVGGEKVMPSEIEDYIMSIDQVIDCTAFPVPNGITGQAVGVRIVAAKNSDFKILKKHIRQICKVGMERFKVPAKITFSFDLKYTDRFKKER